jgi:hypothetical protein
VTPGHLNAAVVTEMLCDEWPDLAEACIEPNGGYHPSLRANRASGTTIKIGVQRATQHRPNIPQTPVERRLLWFGSAEPAGPREMAIGP